MKKYIIIVYVNVRVAISFSRVQITVTVTGDVHIYSALVCDMKGKRETVVTVDKLLLNTWD